MLCVIGLMASGLLTSWSSGIWRRVVWPIATYILKKSTDLVFSALRMEVPGVSETVVEETWALWDAVLFPLSGLS